MNYRDIIDEYEPKIEKAFKDGRVGEAELKMIRQARKMDDDGIVFSAETRRWLRALKEKETPAPCERLDSRYRCEWLSRKEPTGAVMDCPFRNTDPRECQHYWPAVPRGRGGVRIHHEHKS